MSDGLYESMRKGMSDFRVMEHDAYYSSSCIRWLLGFNKTLEWRLPVNCCILSICLMTWQHFSRCGKPCTFTCIYLFLYRFPFLSFFLLLSHALSRPLYDLHCSTVSHLPNFSLSASPLQMSCGQQGVARSVAKPHHHLVCRGGEMDAGPTRHPARHSPHRVQHQNRECGPAGWRTICLLHPIRQTAKINKSTSNCPR